MTTILRTLAASGIVGAVTAGLLLAIGLAGAGVLVLAFFGLCALCVNPRENDHE